MTDPIAALSKALTGRYRIERELGAGGMATVYLAEDTKHHRRVAVKMLRPELAASLGAERFVREIEIAAGLQHPHILSLHDSGSVDGVLFYVMPFVEGHSLRERLNSSGALPVDEALRILREIVDALAYSHEHGVVHRDIKPENIMLTRAHALVMDFGIAKAVSDANSNSQLTSAGMAMGTPTYMAPEQIMADPAIDHRVDIYAVGVLAYELLTGRAPFVGGGSQQVIAAHLTQKPEPLTAQYPAISPQLEAIVLRCLAKNPADRWQSARELHHALDVAAQSGTQTVPRFTLSAKTKRRLALGGLLTVALMAGGTVWFMKEGRAGTLIGNDVLAPNDLILVTEFQNRTADSTLAATVTDAVRVELQQSRLVKVMSQTTMFAALRRMQLVPGAVLDPTKVQELAEREGAKAYVAGDIARIGGGYQLTARVVATNGGADVLTVISKAKSEAELIAAVEQLGRQLRSQIGESLRNVANTPALGQVTTSSLAALRLYSTAVRAGNSGDRPRAITLAKQALTIDSMFAGAWNVLYVAYANSGMPEQMNDAISHAYALRDRLPEAEMLITSARYHTLRSEFVEAEEAYRQLVAQGKQFSNYANLLLERRRFAEAEEMSRRAVTDAPQSAVGYWNLVEAQLVQRRFVQAESTIQSARAAVPTSALRYQMDISLPLAKRDFEAAAAMLQKTDVGAKLKELTPDIPYGCMVLLARGQLRAFSQCDSRRPDMQALFAMAEYRMTADSVRVRRGYENFLSMPVAERPLDTYANVIALLAELGRVREADQLYTEWRTRAKGTAPSFVSDSAYAVGAIAAANHQWERAAAAFLIWHKSPMPSSWHFFNRGLAEAATALEHVGKVDSAVTLYELALSLPAMAGGPAYERLWYGETLEKLGDTYAARGEREKAAQYYRQFVTTYRDADAPISTQVDEVKAKLAKLGAEPTPAPTKVGKP